MSRARVLGPRAALPRTLEVLQDLGFLHLSAPASAPALAPGSLSPRELRLERQLRRMLDDVETALALLGGKEPAPGPSPPPAPPWTAWARSARRTRHEADRLRERTQVLNEERALLAKYQEVMTAFGGLFQRGVAPGVRAYLVVLRSGQGANLEKLRALLDVALRKDYELRTHPLAGGELVLLLLVPVGTAAHVERLLAESAVEQVPLPRGYEGQSLTDAVPRMVQRLHAIPGELAELDALRARMSERAAGLALARAVIQDRLARLDGLRLAASSAHAFVLEGWIPTTNLPDLVGRLAERVGPEVAVEEVAAEQWTAEAPVVLQNPRLFRPFQLLVGMLPLPRYGTIDPTPFVAIFFPLFFGLMVGDVGYGLLLFGTGLVLRWRSIPASRLRAVSEIAIGCALFTVIFGVLFGEFFGDLGRRWFGMRPLVLDREEPRDIVSFLGLCVALGLVHVVLGLALGVASAFRGHRRQAVGRGLSAVMILLIAAALLAVLKVLPHALLTPLVVALLVLFPLLVVAEGLVAPVELLSTVGNILSY
ncbi:MAG TPA: V-type ATPase 116kDa subunit family protein, partial [Myxococcaceae bacterium]|nr:V-type ATPase 116kDa subunit family protein [Myxococcaceae bacterium]